MNVMFQREAGQGYSWLIVVAILSQTACSDDKTTNSSDEVVAAWRTIGLEPIELSEVSESTKKGRCLRGKVAKLHVDLCTYDDAVAADSAKEEGLAKLGSFTGTALVRDRHVLIVSDVDRTDVHGKTLNALAKVFLKPSIASSE